MTLQVFESHDFGEVPVSPHTYTVSCDVQTRSSCGQSQPLQQSLPQCFHAQKRCVQRLQAASDISEIIPEVLPTDNVADLEKILAEKGECGVGSC